MRWFPTYVLGVAALLASAQASFAGLANPQVLVTVAPLKSYMDSLMSGIGQSQSLLRPGQDAHTFMMSPSQRRALAEADFIVLPDRGMNALLDKLLATEVKRGATIIALSELKEAQSLPYEKKNPWLEAAGIDPEDDHEDDAVPEETPLLADHHYKKGNDPHLWLDPIRMAQLAGPIAEVMAKRLPGERDRLRENARLLSDHLREEVDPGIAALLRNKLDRQQMSARPTIPFITYHAAYQYFVKRYDLQPMGEITQRPEDYLGARTLRDVMASAGKVTINCIISETDSPLVRRIATSSNAKIMKLSPEAVYSSEEVPPVGWAKNDYDRLLLKTAVTFAGCL